MASSNDQYQGTDSEKRANVIQEFDPSLLAYHGDRRQGLVPPCEEPGWGFEEPERRDLYRDIYDTKVAKSFLEIDWNKGFTGRGVDPALGGNALVGPKGEALEDVTGAEPPTTQQAKESWRAVDNGEDEGVDPIYKYYRNASSNEDDEGPLGESDDDDEDIGPLGERIDDDEIGTYFLSKEEANHHAQPERDGVCQTALQKLAAQGCEMFEDDSADEPRQQAELDPSGEMRNTLDQIFEGGSQSHKEPKASNQDAESSTAHLVERAGSCKKRDWDSFVGVATKSSKDEAEDSPSTFCPSPKRQRNSQDVELQAFIRPNRVIDENYDDHTDNESEGNASPPTIRASPDLSCASQTAVQRQERAGDSQGLLDQNPHSANSDIKKAGVQLKDTKSRGTKRPRDSSADIVAEGSAEERCPPQAKRPRLEIDTLDDHDLTDSDYQSDVDVESDTTNSDDGSNIEDTLIDNQESVPGGTEDKTRLTFQQTQEDGKRLVRPTFFGIRSWWNKDTKKLVRFTDDNESGDWVVTGMRQGQLGAYASILGSSNGVEPGNRSWTAEEEETLRFWVQDNGIQRWDVIAWCLRRREQECREQYTDIVVLRNKQAGRDPHAGLPGWEDPELAPTPEELAEEDARKAARREAAKEAREAEAAKEAGKAANQEPNTTVRSEPEPWPEVQGEEPEFLYEVPVKVDEEEEAPAGLQVPAPTTLPAESEKIPSSRLRTRKAKTSVKVGSFGLICYDPKAKAFPRVTQTGALVDSKGELLSTNEQEGGGSGGNQESSSGGGASDLEDIGGNSDQTGGNGSDTGADHRIGRYRYRVMQGRITKRPGCGARRGIDRRAGHRRK